MLKPEQGLLPTNVTQQSHCLDTAEHLPLSEQFEAIQNQARHEAIAEKSEYPEQIVKLTKMTPVEIAPEIYLSLTYFEQTGSTKNSTGCGQCLTNVYRQCLYRRPGPYQ